MFQYGNTEHALQAFMHIAGKRRTRRRDEAQRMHGPRVGSQLSLFEDREVQGGTGRVPCGSRAPSHSERSTFEALAGNATLPPVSNGGNTVVVSAWE